MAQAILIESNQVMHELLAINLKNYVGLEIIPRKDASEAIGLLDILPDIELIVTRFKIGMEETTLKIIEYIEKNQLEIGLIIIGEPNLDLSEKAVVIKDDKDWEEVIKSAARILGITTGVLPNTVLPDYIPIPTNYFLPLTKSCCDVYIRIKKGPEDFQFIKRIHANDNFTREEIQKYVDQGLKSFYIPKKYRDYFTNFVTNQLVYQLKQQVYENEVNYELLSESYEVAINEIMEMGFTSSTIELTETLIETMFKTFEKSKGVSSFIAEIINAKSNYMYQHCHLTSVVSNQILNSLDLDVRNKYEKLTYAAFFHDMSLSKNDNLAKVRNNKEIKRVTNKQSEIDQIHEHALKSAEIIRSHPDAPVGVDQIIREHHGSLDGRGFNSDESSKLNPLSRVLIIAEDFVSRLLKYAHDKKSGARPLLKELNEDYAEPEMKKVIQALEKSLK